ncbi:MAG: hypothetical protein QG629_756 [Patescibacteria group bacterium]|nr:hypothetical protein [Patescibacteria group bacterium]
MLARNTALAVCAVLFLVAPAAGAVPSQQSQSNQNGQKNWAKQANGNGASEKASSTRRETSSSKAQKQCENRRNTAENKVKAFSNSTHKSYDQITQVFTKIIALKEASSVQTDKYEELLSMAASNQELAAASISKLEVLAAHVDCAADPTASTADPALIKQRAAQARISLHNYKKSVKSLLAAVKHSVSATTPQKGRKAS